MREQEFCPRPSTSVVPQWCDPSASVRNAHVVVLLDARPRRLSETCWWVCETSHARTSLAVRAGPWHRPGWMSASAARPAEDWQDAGMTTQIVLVPGFWLGAWAWDHVAPLLADRGYAVTPLTLPGLEP